MARLRSYQEEQAFLDSLDRDDREIYEKGEMYDDLEDELENFRDEVESLNSELDSKEKTIEDLTQANKLLLKFVQNLKQTKKIKSFLEEITVKSEF